MWQEMSTATCWGLWTVSCVHHFGVCVGKQGSIWAFRVTVGIRASKIHHTEILKMKIPAWNVQNPLPKCKYYCSDAHCYRSFYDSLLVKNDFRLAVNLRFPSDKTLDNIIILSSLMAGRDTGWLGSAHYTPLAVENYYCNTVKEQNLNLLWG